MNKKSIIDDVVEKASNRRRFLGTIGVASAALAAAHSTGLAQGAGPTDIDILNFALNLEFLEAEFYSVATTGMTLAQLGFNVGGFTSPTSGQAGPTTGGMLVSFKNQSIFTGAIAKQLASDEQNHVVLLQTTLGSAAVAKPAINLDALGYGFKGEPDFLQLGRAFEDVGVTAYAGAAPLLAASPYLGTAARILGTEAEHAGNIRLQIARLGVTTVALDGADILPPPTGFKAFSVNSSSLVETRTPEQVLYLVYGFVQGVTMGGFFPSGMNGFYHTVPSSAPATLD